MQFALLIYETPQAFATRTDDSDSYQAAWRTYYHELVRAGVYVDGLPLELPETGTTVKLEAGKRRVQDGPFADTKEQLAGFCVLELPSLDVALDWAARCPAAAMGGVELRPIANDVKHRLTR
jgi:hypothetical protein